MRRMSALQRETDAFSIDSSSSSSAAPGERTGTHTPSSLSGRPTRPMMVVNERMEDKRKQSDLIAAKRLMKQYIDSNARKPTESDARDASSLTVSPSSSDAG